MADTLKPKEAWWTRDTHCMYRECQYSTGGWGVRVPGVMGGGTRCGPWCTTVPTLRVPSCHQNGCFFHFFMKFHKITVISDRKTVGDFRKSSKLRKSWKIMKFIENDHFSVIERRNAYDTVTSDCTETRFGNDASKRCRFRLKISGVGSDLIVTCFRRE